MQTTVKTDGAALRAALQKMREGVAPLLRFDPGNWRKLLLDASDAFFKGPEELRALARMLQENRNADAARWFREASVGKPAPLPEKRFDKLALVFKMIAAAPRKAGAASVSENIDLPFALENAWPDLDKRAAYDRFKADVLAPFVAEVEKFAGALDAKVTTSGKFDLGEIAQKALKG